MANYLFRYRIKEAPTGTPNGSGQLAHPVAAVYLEDTGTPPSAADWAGAPVVPGFECVIFVPASEVLSALASGTTQQKIAAYKNALVRYRCSRYATPAYAWSEADMERFLDANDQAKDAATSVSYFVNVVLARGFPIELDLSATGPAPKRRPPEPSEPGLEAPDPPPSRAARFRKWLHDPLGVLPE